MFRGERKNLPNTLSAQNSKRSRATSQQPRARSRLVTVLGFALLAVLLLYFRYVLSVYSAKKAGLALSPEQAYLLHQTSVEISTARNVSTLVSNATDYETSSPAKPPVYLPHQPLKPIVPFSMVDHLWKYSTDRKVNVFDSYWAAPYEESPDEYHPVLYTDGWLPVQFINGNTDYKTDLFCEIGGSPPAEAKPLNECDTWGCTCQGASDCFQTAHGVGWGSMPKESQRWWLDQGCQTQPAGGACPGSGQPSSQEPPTTQSSPSALKVPVEIFHYVKRDHQINPNKPCCNFRGPPDDRTTNAWVVCQLPKGTDRTRLGEVQIRLADGKGFEVAVPSKPWPPPQLQPDADKTKYRSVFCVAPVYGLVGTKWLIEWLEYHRAIGIEHIEFYDLDLPAVPREVVLHYAKAGYLTVHDWGERDSERHSTVAKCYQSAKYQMMADCMQRNKGVADYTIIGDIDELFSTDKFTDESSSEKSMEHIFRKADEIRAKSPEKVAFNIKSRTIFPVCNLTAFGAVSPSMILSATATGDKTGVPGYAEGKWHSGRQKFFVSTKAKHGRMHHPWTHAIADDWSIAEKLTHVFDIEDVHQRHYQSHWYRAEYNIANIHKRGLYQRRLPQWLLQKMWKNIQADPVVRELYKKKGGKLLIPWGYENWDQFKYPGDKWE